MHHTENEELFYQLALTFTTGVGPRMGRTLIEHCGSAAEVFRLPLKQLRHIDGIGEVKARNFKDPEVLKLAEKEVEFVIKNNVKTIFCNDNYPTRLNLCSDAPLLLFCKGNVDLNAQRIVAIVGTRRNTDYGQQLTEELVEGLAQVEGLLIVSGLALGIDAIAHKRSVALGLPNVGVLGHGLDRIYPFNHQELAKQMVENGGVLTEFPSGTIPDKGNFPMRNRVVAGLSDVTVVVESTITGGALITAKMASGYNREVAAYPGRVKDSRSAGCNELIRTNTAAMLTSPADLIDLMNWGDKSKKKPVQRQLFINFTPDEQKVVDLLQTKDSVHADELFHHTGLPNSLLAATLLNLEMQGIIKALPGKNYRMS